MAAPAGGARPPAPAVVLGLGDAFARPLRAILTLIAIFVGVITVTVALTDPRSFGIVNSAATAGNVDVVVRRSPALADSDAMRIITAEEQTARVVGELDQNVAVPGVGDPVNARIFRGDSSRLGFLLVTGRWFTSAGEVVAPRALMQNAHLKNGDRFTITVAIAGLRLKDSSHYFMNYRFARDPTSAQLQADIKTLRDSLPAGSVTSSTNYLVIRTVFNIFNQITSGILLAFSAFALLATADAEHDRPGQADARRQPAQRAAAGGADPLLVGEIYDTANLGYSLFLDWSTVSPVQPDVAPSTYVVTVTPGSDIDPYVRRVAAAQPDLLDVRKNDGSVNGPLNIVNVMLIVAVVIIAIVVAGIFNTLLLNTRERVRDTATLKAIGMSPRQVMVMVAASAAPLALVGGVIAPPAGVGLNRLLLTLINNLGGNDTPPALYEVFAVWELLAIPLGGVAVAMAAALIPGRWAARTNVLEVLHAE